MKSVKQLLKEKYNLSNYQIAQLAFLGKTLISEISKLLMIGLIFHKQLPLYLFALSVMLVLRCSTGGIHFDSYISCLFMSFLYLWLGICILPQIGIPLIGKLFILLGCAFVCYRIGPVPSKYRPPFSDAVKQRYRTFTSDFVLLYLVALYIIPDSRYLITGFWIIVLHALQLMLAKYKRKED